MTTPMGEPRDYVVREVPVPAQDLARFEPLIGSNRYIELRRTAADASQRLRTRTVWNFNSTAAGGGVAEMLRCSSGTSSARESTVRWLVIAGDAEFFSVTKRIHNRLHGVPGDLGALDDAAAAALASVPAANAGAIAPQVRPGDVVILHDPQTAGMAALLAELPARSCCWRCHVGAEERNEWTEEAWAFLRPHLAVCDGFVFSRREYVPAVDSHGPGVRIIPPSIDPFSPKNQVLSEAGLRILAAMGGSAC